MHENNFLNLSDFYYNLPEELIAQEPLKDRDLSRLMVLNKHSGHITHKRFKDIVEYLTPGDCLVLNDTKVIPARLLGKTTDSDKDIELLLLKSMGNDIWEVMTRPGKHTKIGQGLIFGNGLLHAEVIDIVRHGNRLVEFSYNVGNFEDLLHNIGLIPLPPYIHKKLDDDNSYQTTYSKNPGSSAAPTAGLHFTPALLELISQKNIAIAYVTLHVGLGTFRPVRTTNITQHIMHEEFFNISQESCDKINHAKSNGKSIIAVGTTSCRVLETACNQNGIVSPSTGYTDIFIYPGYKFKIADKIITNFHLPESTLLMLISALAGTNNVLNAYKIAVEEKYRFFSFGDAMLIC